MKKDGKYRFSLQFASDTDEQIQAGELLERLGNKKSSVIIAALNEYMVSHPELIDGKSNVEVKITSSFNKEKIRRLIKDMIQEQLSSSNIALPQTSNDSQTEINDNVASEFLKNLDLFQ